jgi:mannose-6-phosphate isomerase-like protein (cupin superfamily)
MASSKEVLVIDLKEEPANQKLLSGAPQTYGMRSGRVYLAPGQACGQHSTEDREELLVFLSGQGELIIDEKDRFRIGRGKVSYIPKHTIHNVKSAGTEPLVYIYCVAPTAQE